jgi:hypothetical protein
MEEITFKLGNYYGYLTLVKKDVKYYLSLDDHSSTDYLEIDKITYDNLLRFSDVETLKEI